MEIKRSVKNNRNEDILSCLKRMALSGDVPHAMVFCGAGREVLRLAAIEFIKTLICIEKKEPYSFCGACVRCKDAGRPHGARGNFFVLSGEEKSISIDEVRSIRGKLAYTAPDGGKKIVLIEGAERLTLEASSALLKTLEEPRGDACIILLCERLFLLPATIRSRLFPVRFSSFLPNVPDKEQRELVLRVAKLSRLPLYQRLVDIEKLAASRDPLVVCDAAVLFLRGVLLSRRTRGLERDIAERIKDIFLLRRVLERKTSPPERVLALLATKL